MTRQQANLELAELLLELVKIHPELRFGQILQTYDFVVREGQDKPDLCNNWKNEFYLESLTVLKRVIPRLRHQLNIEKSKNN